MTWKRQFYFEKDIKKKKNYKTILINNIEKANYLVKWYY